MEKFEQNSTESKSLRVTVWFTVLYLSSFFSLWVIHSEINCIWISTILLPIFLNFFHLLNIIFFVLCFFNFILFKERRVILNYQLLVPSTLKNMRGIHQFLVQRSYSIISNVRFSFFLLLIKVEGWILCVMTQIYSWKLLMPCRKLNWISKMKMLFTTLILESLISWEYSPCSLCVCPSE